MEVAEVDRESLLRTNSQFADVNLAHLLKDICLDGWSIDPARAVAASESLALLYKLEPDQEVQALYLWSLGLQHLVHGEMEPAIEELSHSRQIFNELDRPTLGAATQVSKLIALAMLGRYEEAIACGLEARGVFQDAGDRLSLGKIEHNIGNIYFRRDQYREAEQFQRSARTHFEHVGDLIQLAKIENSLALTLSQQHQTKAAEELYEQALARAEAVGLKSTQAELESSIGTLALYQGYYDRALDYLERSRRRYTDLDQPHLLALTEQEIADAYLELNMNTEAVEIYRRVESQFAALGMHAEEARAFAYHGRIEIVLGNFAKARELLARSRQLYQQEGNDLGAAVVELTEAQLFYANGDLIATRASAEEAESVLASAGNPRRVVFARWLQGEAARLQGDTDNAHTLLTETLDQAQGWQQPDIVARCLTSLGLLLIDAGQHELAKEKFKAAIEVIEKLRAPLPAEEFRTAFFSDKLVPYRELTLLALNSDYREALYYAERARSRSLVDLLGGSVSLQLTPQNDAELALVHSINDKRHKLNYFYRQLNQSTQNAAQIDHKSVEELQREVHEHESAIAEITRQLLQGKRSREVRDEELDLTLLQQQLGPERALIEYVALNDELLAFVVTDTEVEVVRDLGSITDIGGEVTKFRFQIDSLRYGSAAIRKHLDSLTVRVQSHLKLLFDKLLRPLVPHIGDRSLSIVPTGLLHYLPFHALFDGEQHLIQTHAVSYAASATVLQHCLSRPGNSYRSALLVGVPDERAPRIAEEVKELAAFFPDAKLLLGADATVEQVKREAEKVDLLHLACHAQFRQDNPQFSALQLGDGWLTLSDTYNLRLSSGLVTLSACETGVNAVTAGEELVGLARGFLSAGTPSVLLSLWTVDDQATQELMSDFYRDLLLHGSPAKSLQAAQIRMLNKRPHPFFWSSFALVGRW